MGTWGPAIFSDDLAMDIRGQFRDLIAEGMTPQEATAQILAEYETSSEDSDESPVFWLALAATQWQLGRLQPEVKDRALAMIEAGADVRRWQQENPKLAPERLAAVHALRDRLLSPQPAPRKLAKPFHNRTDWRPGDAIAYRLVSGRWCVLRVLHVEEDGPAQTPVVELCDWIGDEPGRAEIERLPRRYTVWLSERTGGRPPVGPPPKKPNLGASVLARLESLLNNDDYLHRMREHVYLTDGLFALYSVGRRDPMPVERVRVIATGLNVTPHNSLVGVCFFGGWRDLDAYLAEAFAVS